MGKPEPWKRPRVTGLVSRMRKHAATLRRNRRGATIIEFALVATPLAALIVAIFQTSLTFFAQQTLETAAEKSVRQLMTGQAQQASMTSAQFQALACSNLPSFMNCNNLYIDVEQADSFADVSTTPPTITYNAKGAINNAFIYNPGGAGSINVAKIMYIWHEQRGPLGFNLSNLTGDNRLLIATSAFKAEPYDQ
jgi:Flp pilus assembly protein TadG